MHGCAALLSVGVVAYIELMQEGFGQGSWKNRITISHIIRSVSIEGLFGGKTVNLVLHMYNLHIFLFP